ncbi:transcriptional regulator [Rhodoferax saidenbachensis]|uniref:Transcriptional regulator n=2 Tax=Rhodoferax saidenbachensis TaxID=1484693 RepID=A0A1P8K7T2_9BURK|nr:helix-turn-helix transcriptional regulator [Rhodoferax saidenbachensis]APW42021.1 transcriptional regulator [Rhodoferax saidenbachensis]
MASTFGVRLRKFRMAKNLSLQQLADEVGASKAHIWDLEQGKTSNPTLALLTELSRALAIPIKELIGEVDASADEENLAPLFRDLRGLTPEQLEVVRGLTKNLREMGNGGKSRS